MQDARAGERAALAEPRRPGVQPLLAVDVDVEERVEEVEAGDPRGDRGAERPRLPRQLALDRRPGADRREPVDRAEPEVAQPREPLQVRVDDERDDRDRREPADERVELPDGDEVDERATPTQKPITAAARQRARRQLARRPCAGSRRRCRASISRFSAIASERAPTIATVIQSRSCADGTPSTARNAPTYANGQREDRVLELDEPVVEAGDPIGLTSARAGSARRARSDSAWPSAGRRTA